MRQLILVFAAALVMMLSFTTVPSPAQAEVRTIGSFDQANGLAVSRSGHIYVAERSRVLKLDAAGTVVATFGSAGAGNGQFDGAMDVAVDADENVYVVDAGGNLNPNGSRLTRFSPSGAVDWVVNGSSAWELTVTAGGELWGAEPNGRRVQQYSRLNGAPLASFAWGNAIGGPHDVAGAVNGNLVISGTHGPIEEVTPAGQVTRTFPSGSDFVALGTDDAGNAYAVGQLGGQLRKFSPGGSVLASMAVESAVKDIEVGPGEIVWALDGARLLRIDPRTPEARIGASEGITATATPVTFDASASVAHLASITAFDWDLDGDGTFETNTGTSAIATTSFATVGPRTVSVRVSVTGGGSRTASTGLDVRLSSPSGPVGVSINNGAQFTNDPSVTVTARWPRLTTALLISNDGGFAGAQGLSVAPTVPWRLDASGPERLPKTIYVRFGGPETYQDDIILDQTAPEITSASLAAPTAGVARAAAARRLILEASDATSGVAQVELGDAQRSVVRSLPYATTLAVGDGAAPHFVRVRDHAGNLSPWRALSSTTVSLPRTVRAGALRRGLQLSVTCQTACRATAGLYIDRTGARRLGVRPSGQRTRVGVATRRRTDAGRLIFRVRPSARAQKRMTRLRGRTIEVRVHIAGAGTEAQTVRRVIRVRR